jgi:hypothetical protein
MAPRTTPLALPPALPSELLTYILTHQAYPTTVLICQHRATFLISLLNSIKTASLAQEPPLPPKDETAEPTRENPRRHPLLIPTLHQIVTSKHVKLVFIPTVSHFRAYLAAFPPPTSDPPPEQVFDKPGKKVPLLLVYGLVELHRDTSEWSAQGLENSVSILVEAGWRSDIRVVVVEEKALTDEYHQRKIGEDDDEEVEKRKWKQLCKVWEQRVPMLNGSVRRAGLDSEDGAWSGRTVEVGRILARWFKFGRDDWTS